MHLIVMTFREAVIKVEVANFGAAIDTLIDQDGWCIACSLMWDSSLYSKVFDQFPFPVFIFCLSNFQSLCNALILSLYFSVNLSPFWCHFPVMYSVIVSEFCNLKGLLESRN